MNKHEDSLEAELASWKPAPVSEQLKQRIGKDVARIIPFRRRVWILAGTLGAACLLLVLLLRPKSDDHADSRSTVLATSNQPNVIDDELPSLRAYTQALNQSSDALDALLNRHGSSVGMSSASMPSVQAFFPHHSPLTN